MSVKVLLTLFLIGFELLSLSHTSDVIIKKVTMRHLKKHDFGLLFDVIVANVGSSSKETLRFHLHSEKCCLEVHNTIDCEMPQLIGVRGDIEPGAEEVVTVIFPTVILFNLIGKCVLNLDFQRRSGELMKEFSNITFNTTIDSLPMLDHMI
ncbi:unnamed protein product, partial [Diamesa tonsa]